MKVKDFKNWKKIIFNDRIILRDDLRLMSAEQIKNLEEMEVLTAVANPPYESYNLYMI